MTAEAPSTAAQRVAIRASLAARRRYAEDELTRAIARGATQYVVLGAGLDTHAYCNLYPRLRVFEVDFEQQTLCSALQSSGFQRDEVSFFSWLGVAPYITSEAVMTTLAFIGSMPAGSGVVFDYAVERSSLCSAEQTAMDALASRVARAGEPFRLSIDPRALEGMLRAAGFHVVEDLGPAAINEMYFDSRADGLQVSAGVAHLVNARV